MKTLELQLTDGPKLTDCRFDRRKGKSGTDGPASVSVQCEYSFMVNINNEKNEAYAALKVKSDTEGVPFSFEVGARAKFKCKGKCPSEGQIIIKAYPYLFSFTKEIVSDLTRKANLKPFDLKSIELDLERDLVKKEAKG